MFKLMLSLILVTVGWFTTDPPTGYVRVWTTPDAYEALASTSPTSFGRCYIYPDGYNRYYCEMAVPEGTWTISLTNPTLAFTPTFSLQIHFNDYKQVVFITIPTGPQPACTPPGGDLTRAVDEQVTVVAYSSCYLTVRRGDGTTRTVFVGFAEKDWTPSIGTVIQLRYDPVSLQGFYLISQTYPWKDGVVVPTPTPTPTPIPTPTPVPTPTSTPTPLPSPSPAPSPSPTPVPPSTCSITVPASLSMSQWSYAVVTVSLADLTGPVSVSAYSNTGQVTVYPSSQSVTGTSASLQFQVSSKKKSGTVTFNSPCGSRTLQVIVK